MRLQIPIVLGAMALSLIACTDAAAPGGAGGDSTVMTDDSGTDNRRRNDSLRGRTKPDWLRGSHTPPAGR